MDFQRYLLIGAIAVLSYMLLIEWGQFKAENAPAQTVNSFEAQQQNQTIPQTPVATAPAELSDLPTQTADVATPAVVEETVQAVSTTTIHVKTNSLEVGIDPVGGDIVFAALPKHYAAIDTPDVPFVILENSAQRTYIAQSGLIGANGTDTSKGRPHFSSDQTSYTMAESSDTLNVDLHYTNPAQPQVKITKRFTFHRDEYLIDIQYLIENNSNATWSAGLFGQIKRDNTADPAADTSGMGMAPYLGAAITLPDEPYKKISFEDIAEKPFKTTNQGGWVAIVQHYFLTAWIPDATQTHNYATLETRDQNNLVRFTSPAVTVAPGQTETIKSQFYIGPKDQYRLEEISPGLELSVDYGFLWMPAQALFWLLTKFFALTGNWGWAIILVTVLVKALFYSLNKKAYTSMANMRKVQPKLMELRERYADDRQKQSQEMMNLYKKEKINPLGGCLPILVQMPVFISLYWVLMESVELRHAPFMLWIDDLAAMDPYFILPLLMGASMFIQQKLNPPPPDPMQAKVMQWMPVLFTFFFLFFPAGLVLYWVVNNVLSIAQQYVITKRIENE